MRKFAMCLLLLTFYSTTFGQNQSDKAIRHGLGSVNQFVDSTNQTSNNSLCEMLKALYR